MIQTRECTKNDFHHIKRLLFQLWPDLYDDENYLKNIFEKRIDKKSHFLICAEEDDSIIGFCSLVVKNTFLVNGLYGQIDEVVVDDTLRNKGIGKILLDEVIKIAMKAGCRMIELNTAFHRVNAHKFYEKYGFKKVAFVFSMDIE